MKGLVKNSRKMFNIINGGDTRNMFNLSNGRLFSINGGYPETSP